MKTAEFCILIDVMVAIMILLIFITMVRKSAPMLIRIYAILFNSAPILSWLPCGK